MSRYHVCSSILLSATLSFCLCADSYRERQAPTKCTLEVYYGADNRAIAVRVAEDLKLPVFLRE